LWRALLYGGLLAALLYTHYVGVFIALTHGLHLLLTQPRHSRRFLLPGLIAAVLYAPWLPVLYWQITTHGGAAAYPFTDLNTAMAALIYFLTGGYWWLYALPILGCVLHIFTSPPNPLSIHREGESVGSEVYR
jgi:hypothetical protein